MKYLKMFEFFPIMGQPPTDKEGHSYRENINTIDPKVIDILEKANIYLEEITGEKFGTILSSKLEKHPNYKNLSKEDKIYLYNYFIKMNQELKSSVENILSVIDQEIKKTPLLNQSFEMFIIQLGFNVRKYDDDIKRYQEVLTSF